nr:hypothetical protein [Tanacetum cinerariifolium]
IYTLPFDLNNSMDKSWMRTSRTKKQYIDGVEAFIKYAVHNLQNMRNIDPPDGPATVEMVNATKESFDEGDLAKIQEVLLDAKKPLYKGCPDFTKLSAIVKLLNLNGYPGNDIAIFLEPLVNDLHTIFKTGVDTYDTSTKENFNLRAIVLWTINDYLVLGTLCGCPYSGFKGYVVYGKDTHYKAKKVFNGQQEFQLALNPLTEEQIYNEVQHIKNKRGKGKRTNNKTSENQEDTRGRGGKIQKQKRKTTELEGSSNRVNEAYWKKFNIWYRKLRCMKVIKGHVRNKNIPEGCIAEETIVEETIEFFSEYHKTIKPIGIPPDKHATNVNEDENPLLTGKSSEVSREVFQKAHLYVI